VDHVSSADTYRLLHAMVDELARCGMTDACTAPGSRSTPLVVSLVREPRLACHSHIDERCAGFFALGLARATGRPVAVACTSGTAAAELAPAVIEAHQAGVPLIVLTADRPPELREVGAGQTIDQLKLYGDAVKWFFEVGVADAEPERLRWMRSLACRAYWTTLEGKPGPAQLNFPLREPLVPPADLDLSDDHTARGDGQPYVVVEPPHLPPPAEGPGPHPSGRLLIVAGAGTPDPAGVAAFAERAGIPLLADPLSGARRGGAAIAHYDLLLRDAGFAEQRPQFVFRLGDLPTSKPLRTWLADLTDAAQIAFDPHSTWQDPAAVVGMRLRSALPQPDQLEVEPGWLDAWRVADVAAAQAIDACLPEDLSEPAVARLLGQRLPAEATLVVASSMPIRDVESFFPARDPAPRVLSNRGANGIDGTVSTAFGVAAADQGPVVLLTGDVALAYDIGGLLAARRLGLKLAIVLLNNGGGGIFDFLPVSELRDLYEHHVATAPGLEFDRVAALYGLGYTRAGTASELLAALDAALAHAGSTLIEVPGDRQANLQLHRRISAAVGQALGRQAAAR
jgi:2-succinyl-5-enolpyruvyl-6-hydroxy-3-cyclohexene-1-carboxylate synthase